jgi:ubiquinone/menaquinone biosynthesis C-methylase UbiE
MKNILDDKPSRNLNGRLKANVNFVNDKDLKGKTVLDIGCGYGWCELNFLKRGVKKIIGIEITEDDLKTVKGNIKNKKAEFKVGSAINLPFKNDSIDTVVSWEVIEHIPKNTEGVMFKEASRVLKKGGHFYLSTPYKSLISNIFDPAWFFIGHRHYSEKQLTHYAKGKFKIVNILIKGKFWSAFSILNLYISKWILRRSPIFANFIATRVNHEYKIDNGYVNIFVKYQKI